MIVTSGFLTALECTKFLSGWGCAPDPAGGAYSAPPDSLAGWRDPTSNGRGGNGGKRGVEKRREKEGEVREVGKKGRGGKETPPVNSCLHPWHVRHAVYIITSAQTLHALRILHGWQCSSNDLPGYRHHQKFYSTLSVCGGASDVWWPPTYWRFYSTLFSSGFTFTRPTTGFQISLLVLTINYIELHAVQ